MNSLKSVVKNSIPENYLPGMIGMYYNLRSLLYIGNEVTCPCCGGTFSKFLAYGSDEPQEDSQCPRCGGVERHRILWLYLQNKTNFFKDRLKVLHFAPEYWFQKNFKNLPNLEYITTDLFDRLAMVKMDITNITYEDNQFDVILCSHVLEHIPDEHKAISELLRILKPSGWAILQVPLDTRREKTFEDTSIVSPEDRKRNFGQKDHVRLHGLDYKERLEKAGFKVKVEDYVQELGAEKSKKYKLEETTNGHMCNKIYYCTK